MLPSENYVFQNTLKAFRSNKQAPAGYKVAFHDGISTEKWYDDYGKNPKDVKVFSPPEYSVCDAEGECLFLVSAFHGEGNKIKFFVHFDGDAENVNSWDEAMIVGMHRTVLAEFTPNSSDTKDLADALKSINKMNISGPSLH